MTTKPFREIVSKIKWANKKTEDCVVGYYDRIKDEIIEMPLEEFLSSDIPEHRARYVKKDGTVIWDRRK